MQNTVLKTKIKTSSRASGVFNVLSGYRFPINKDQKLAN